MKCLDYEKEEKRVGHKAYNLSLYDVCTIAQIEAWSEA